MARLSELVKGVAKALHIEQRTVALAARYLREHGLISETGRGLGAAQMTPRDAANLVLALMASDAIKAAALQTKAAGEAAFAAVEINFSGKVETSAEKLPPCGFLRDESGAPHAFGGALVSLIDEIVRFGDPKVGDQPITNLFLSVTRPGRYAVLEIDSGDAVYRVGYRHPDLFRQISIMQPLADEALQLARESRGMRTQTEIGLPELWAIAKVLRRKPRTRRKRV